MNAPARSPSRTLLIFGSAIWAVVFVVGLSALAERIVVGEHRVNYGSYVPWGLWISSYIFFSGISAGACLLAGLVYVFRVRVLEGIGKVSLLVAIVALLMALLSIWVDLGHMERFYYVLLHPNFHSLMAWMVWFYSVYFVVLLLQSWFALAPDLARASRGHGPRAAVARLLLFGVRASPEELRRRGSTGLRVTAIASSLIALAFSGGVGSLFSAVVARPYWHSAIYPVLFLTGAGLSGAAAVGAAYAVFAPVRDARYREALASVGRIVLGLLALDLLLEWSELSVHMWYRVGEVYELFLRVLFGEFWYVFWIFHLLLGALIPGALLLIRPRDPRAVGLALSLTTVMFMAVRLNLVVPAQVTPQIRGLELSYRDPRLVFEYVPSAFEWQVVAFVVALGFGLFWLGRTLLPVFDVPAAAEGERA